MSAAGAERNKQNLLVVSRYSDEHFESADYTFVHHQIRSLRRYFDEIHVVAPTPWFPRWLRPAGRVWEKLRLRMLARDYAFDNVHVHFAPFPPWAGRIPGSDRARGVWPAILRTVRRPNLRFALVHSHMTLQFGWHGAMLGRAYGVPSVLTVHDNHDGLIPVLRAGRWDALAALRENDALIRVSSNDIDEIRALSGTDRPIHYIPNGFDFANVPTRPRDEERRALGLPVERPLFVSVARWVERKDPWILLEALSRLKVRPQGGARPLLCLLGEDVSEGRIARRVAELGLSADVLQLGQRPPSLVLQYMRASDAVVLYSHSEGNPTVMFEALGCGRPYIGSDVGGVNAVIVDERLGLIGPPKDAVRLTELMERALHTRWDETFILAHARQYTWDRVAARIHDEVFAPLLARGAGQRS
jgi:glycosyltransferase involved in cell wall biosynthesis